MIERASPLRPQRLRSRNENGGGRLSHTLRQACGDRTPEVAHPHPAAEVAHPAAAYSVPSPSARTRRAPVIQPRLYRRSHAGDKKKRAMKMGRSQWGRRGRIAARKARGRTGNAPSPGFWLRPLSASFKKCIRPAHSLNSQRRYTRRTRPDHMFFKAYFYNGPCKRKIPLLSVCTAFPL